MPINIKVLKFSATWCGPCKGYAPIFDQVAAQFASDPRVTFESLDVDQNEAEVEHWSVRSVPTTIIAVQDNGTYIFEKSFVGSIQASTLTEAINQALTK